MAESVRNKIHLKEFFMPKKEKSVKEKKMMVHIIRKIQLVQKCQIRANLNMKIINY